MAYSTPADLVFVAGPIRLDEVADYDGDGSADSAVVTRAIVEADAEIDGYARRLYGASLPFSPVDPLIRELSAAEAVYRLKVWRGVQGPLDDEQRVKREAKLSAIAAGTLLPQAVDLYPIGEDETLPHVVVRGETTSFDGCGITTRRSLRGWW